LAGVRAQERSIWLVTVAGEASVTVAPDLAELRAGVTSQGKSAREASEANARAMTKVLATLKDAGIADNDLQTSRLSLHPVHEGSRGPAGKISGFQASNQVMVRIRDIDKVGEILDRAVAAGANDVSGVEFLVSDPSKVLDAARPQAVVDARRKAEIYAKATGLGLGRAAAINEEGFAAPVGMRMSAARATSTPVAPGQETLRVVVTVSFELLR
jgi:uncharacterized protein YggE